MESKFKKLEEKLYFKSKNAWHKYPRKAVFDFAENYKDFLFNAKTERDAVKEIKKMAKRSGFEPFEHNSSLTPGKKYFFENQKKVIALVVVGKEPLIRGANIIVSHIDSPRLDLKQRPLYEEEELAFFKTHYYGGIKKWHWVCHPLALHGVISTKEGDLDIIIGEKESDTLFTITDLLPHLGAKQSEKTGKKIIEGEDLNILVGGIPVDDEKTKNAVKLAILDYLHKEYHIVEEDLICAELCAVPAGKPRDIGFDRAFVGGYGHDDKACSFANLQAVLGISKPEKTCIAFFMDKEEIGSTGASGSESMFFQNVVSQLSVEPLKVLENSRCVSADVDSGVDPTFKEVDDTKNAAYLGSGVSMTKFTGYGGKYDASDANAEYVNFIRQILNKHKIPWQTTELGKVDEGGGGTIAKYIAKYGCNTIDVGLPVLAMHSPFEVLAKIDLYALYNFYKAFLETE